MFVCWYWWNWWPSPFKLSFYNIMMIISHIWQNWMMITGKGESQILAVLSAWKHPCIQWKWNLTYTQTDIINWFNTPHCCAFSKIGFPMSYLVFFFFVFNKLRWEAIVCFVDIVVHHCFNFPFMIILFNYVLVYMFSWTERLCCQMTLNSMWCIFKRNTSNEVDSINYVQAYGISCLW